MNVKTKTWLFLFTLLLYIFSNYIPNIYEHILTEKKLIEMKKTFNEMVDEGHDEKYLHKVQILINNYVFVEDKAIFNYMDPQIIENTYNNLVVKDIPVFYLYSLSFNIGLFLPIFLPILKIVSKKIKQR